MPITAKKYPLTRTARNAGSVTLTFEAIFLAVMMIALVMVLGFNKLSRCQAKESAKWVQCGQVLNCEQVRETCDTEGTPSGSSSSQSCQGDYDGSGIVTDDDIFLFLDAWFSGNGDFDGNGVTSIDDIFVFLNAWFSCPVND